MDSHQDFCSYELSKALKACGFDEPCGKSLKIIPGTEREEWDEEECQWCAVRDIEYYPKISLWQAQKWLREKKKMHCQVLLNGVRSMYFWQVREMIGNGRYADSAHQYDVYEDAMSDCISAALELIKKGE